MGSRGMVYLIGTTLLWSGGAGLLTGFFLSVQTGIRGGWVLADWLVGAVGWVGGGLIFGALSLLGYLVFSLLYQMGRQLFRSRLLWEGIIYLAILITMLDLYLLPNATWHVTWGWVVPAVLILWAILVAYRKMVETNQQAFAPTLFFMFTMTVLELIPALRGVNINSLLDMGIPLVVANSWQVLIMHRLMKGKGSLASSR